MSFKFKLKLWHLNQNTYQYLKDSVGCISLCAYLNSHGIIVPGPGERSAQFGDLPCGFVNHDDVSAQRDVDRDNIKRGQETLQERDN